MDDLHEATLCKRAFIRNAGYHLISVYECEFDEQRANMDREMRIALQKLQTRLRNVEPLNPRHSLNGGRTNALRRMYIPKEGEEVRYYDVNSLYPSINFSMQDQDWPLGHPDVYLWNHPPLTETFGLVKCTLLPPDNLYHPVLGIVANNKLVFGLCGTCINQPDTEEKNYCTHTDEERRISGTFVSEEVKLALRMGYKEVSIEETWHWPESRRSKTLFRPYIAAAYREKQEASGWPEDIKELLKKNDPLAEVRKQEYMDEVKQRMGIEIRPDKVEYNAARRQASKLLLNNFWGFWGKAPNKDTTTYVESLAELYRLLSTKDVGSYFPANVDQMIVCWKEKDGAEKPDANANVVLALFTTAYARMRLYYFMDIVGDRCLYLDTDSVIWIHRRGMPIIETGDLLGEMKDEIRDEYGEHSTIGVYASLGCKTYSLMISDRRTGQVIDWKRKMKGIRPTFLVDQLVPAEKILDMVWNEYSTEVPQRNLRRNRKDTSLEWIEMEKTIRSTFTKRLSPPHGDPESPTLPIGSKKPL